MNSEESAEGYFSCSNWVATQIEAKTIVKILDLQNPRELPFPEAVEALHEPGYPNSILISPKIQSWRLIMGAQLAHLNISIYLLEQLSQKSSTPIVSLGTDAWCAYYSWMYAEGGKISRYYQYHDGEIKEYGFKMEFEKEIEGEVYENCVFKISKKFGLDVESSQIKDFQGEATIWDFR